MVPRGPALPAAGGSASGRLSHAPSSWPIRTNPTGGSARIHLAAPNREVMRRSVGTTGGGGDGTCTHEGGGTPHVTPQAIALDGRRGRDGAGSRRWPARGTGTERRTRILAS